MEERSYYFNLQKRVIESKLNQKSRIQRMWRCGKV